MVSGSDPIAIGLKVSEENELTNIYSKYFLPSPALNCPELNKKRAACSGSLDLLQTAFSLIINDQSFLPPLVNHA